MKKKSRFPLKWKAFLFVEAVAVVIAVLASGACYDVFSDVIEDYHIRSATSIARTASGFLDGDQVERFRDRVYSAYKEVEDPVDTSRIGTQAYKDYISSFDGIEDEDYRQIRSALSKILEANDVDSVYVLSVYETDQIFLYIADASVTQPLTPGAFDLWDETYNYLFESPETGIPADISNSEEYGYICSVMLPLYNSSGNVVAYSCVDISMNELRSVCIAFLIVILVLLAVITFVLCFIAIKAVNRYFVAPINRLTEAAENYVSANGSGGGHVFESVSIHTGDELEYLGSAMVRMENDLDTYIASLTKITAEKERIVAELDVAKRIQEDMLPNIFPAFPDRKEISIYATMTPAKAVGGDFYDFFFTDENHLALVMADVSGKGVSAALFMVIAKTLIKNRAMMGGTPAEILTDVNGQLCESNKSGMFVTVWLTVIDLRNGRALSANAGHEYPAIRREGGNYELVESKHSIALAALDYVKYRNNEFELRQGDSLFVYTDGVTEATDAAEDLFGNDRLLRALNIHPEAEPEDLIPIVKGEIDSFVKDAPQFDDITMLSFRFHAQQRTADEE